MLNVNIYSWNTLSNDDKKKIMDRAEEDISSVLEAVSDIIENVRKKGDSAVAEYNARFDRTPPGMSLPVSEEEFREAEKSLTEDLKEAIRISADNVRTFHLHQKGETSSWMEVSPGVFAGEKAVPVESAGLYVPRGRGSFPSMLYMLAVPAKIAGVPRIVLATPPDSSGKADAACLYTARYCGVDEVYKMGGAHAVAALSLGTETIRPVLKLAGPGSKYVAAAKKLLHGQVDTGMPAGPSESVILADSSANYWKAAKDLMIEAEHGSDSSALLITDSCELAEKCREEVVKMWPSIPEPRKTFIKDVFAGYGGIILVKDIYEGASLVNQLAPEHLQLAVKDPFETQSLIRNAGEILLGQNTPFSVANYTAGANAVLPTGGKAKTYSAVSVRDFIKYSSLVYVTENGLNAVSGTVRRLAEYEEFPMHAEALRNRNV